MTTEPQHEPAPAATAPRPAPGAEAPQSATVPGDLAPGGQPPAAPGQATLPQHTITRTRISGLWVAVGFFAVILLLLLIFKIGRAHV